MSRDIVLPSVTDARAQRARANGTRQAARKKYGRVTTNGGHKQRRGVPHRKAFGEMLAEGRPPVCGRRLRDGKPCSAMLLFGTDGNGYLVEFCSVQCGGTK